jgi:hypothetical protein
MMRSESRGLIPTESYMFPTLRLIPTTRPLKYIPLPIVSSSTLLQDQHHLPYALSQAVSSTKKLTSHRFTVRPKRRQPQPHTPSLLQHICLPSAPSALSHLPSQRHLDPYRSSNNAQWHPLPALHYKNGSSSYPTMRKRCRSVLRADRNISRV